MIVEHMGENVLHRSSRDGQFQIVEKSGIKNQSSNDKFIVTQSLEELAHVVKKQKKRKIRESSQPQYVIVDDPNQILPKRRFKKIQNKSTSNQ